MKFILAALLLLSQSLYAQHLTKEDKKLIKGLRTSVNFLADDKLEGRRTGSAGEKLAYTYIQKEFKKAGLKTLPGLNGYIQPFDIKEGKEISNNTVFILNGRKMKRDSDYIPYSYSGNINNFLFTENSPNVAYLDISELLAENENNPHFDPEAKVLEFAKNAEATEKKLVLVNNMQVRKYDIKFNPKDQTPALKIPVIYLLPKDKVKKNDSDYTGDNKSSLTIEIKPSSRTGHNVIGYINNNAANTIVLGAHYDHLGYGEDHNSLHTGTTPLIHNGADDNASGTAALIELGKWLKRSGYKKYNYALVAFSGEELGLYGSKYFIENAGLDPKKVNYMINMDMIGRLNDSTHGLTIGGYGTSPSWGKLINIKDPFFKINTDSSGSGPSDHTSFYRKDIPVLFFFTGSHKDYHKPGDDAEKINYSGTQKIINYIQKLIADTDKTEKLAFTKTREVTMGKSTFKVSMGIMPDYSYSGSGVRVDGVSENKAAQKAGVKTGDVLMQLGDHKFTDVQSYMEVLNKFNKGESTNVKLKRGMEELILPLTF